MRIPIYDTIKTNKEAKKTLANAQEKYDKAKRKLERAKDSATYSLENLGEVKIKISSECIGKFVELNKFFADTDIPLKISGQGMIKAPVQFDFNVKEMQKVSMNATEIIQGGMASLSAGALAGVAAYGAVATLGTASTGTAIAALSGAAAKSATLAWFGGGSLAAGGLGMAGGALALGGIVLAPALLIADSIMNSKAQEKLAEAREIYQEAKLAAEKMNTVRDFMYKIESLADDYVSFLGSFRGIYDGLLREMENIVNRLKRTPGASAENLTEKEINLLHITWLMTQLLFNLLKAPLLTKKGDIDEKGVKALEMSKELTNDFNNAYISGTEISDATMEKFYAFTGVKKTRAKTSTPATGDKKEFSFIGFIKDVIMGILAIPVYIVVSLLIIIIKAFISLKEKFNFGNTAYGAVSFVIKPFTSIVEFFKTSDIKHLISTIFIKLITCVIFYAVLTSLLGPIGMILSIISFYYIIKEKVE